MKTSLRPIAFGKTMLVNYKEIGLKTKNNAYNLGFAKGIISKYSSLAEYDFDFDSFIYAGLNTKNNENIVRTSKQVIELLLTMNHSFFHVSLDFNKTAYLEELRNQVSFYLSELNIWGGTHFSILQTLYSNMETNFLHESKEELIQYYNKQLYETKLTVEKKNKVKQIKTKQYYSISTPFYHMMFQFMNDRKSLNYKEIWKLSVGSKKRIQSEVQKQQYINHWNQLNEQEKELICNTFDRYNILNYLPEQIINMKENDWLHFIEKIREITKEQNLQTIDNRKEIKSELLHILNVKSSDEFMEKVIQISKQQEQIEYLGKEQWKKFYSKISDYNAKISTLSMIEDFHRRVNQFHIEYKELIQSQPEEIRILSLKNQFLESIESIVKEKQVQGVFSFLEKYIDLSESTKDLEFDIERKTENLKEIISYLDFNTWKSFLSELEQFEERNNKLEENKIKTYKSYILEFLNSSETLNDRLVRTIMEKRSYDLQITDKSQLLKAIETCEYPNELMKLIYLSLESDSLKDAAKLYRKIEEGHNLDERETITKFIDSLEINQWEKLLKEIKKYADIVHIVEKQEGQLDNIMETNQFFHLINEEEKLQKLSKLIGISVQDSSRQDVLQLYKSMEKSLQTELVYEKNINIEKLKIEEFIGSLKSQEWETLYGEIKKYQNAVKILEENEIQTDEENQMITRNRFIDLMNDTKRQEELVELIHKSIEKCFKVEVVKENSLWYKKQKIKEFIGALETEQWEMLYGEIKKYQNVINELERNEVQAENTNQKITSNRFIEVMNKIESPEILAELIHMSVEKSSMEEITKLYKRIENSLKAESVNTEKLWYKKRKIKEFIATLETEQWEMLYGELTKYESVISVLERNEVQVEHTNQKIDKNRFIEIMNEIESPEEMVELIHMSVEKSSMEELTELYNGIVKNFKVEETEEETIWNKKQKMKEFISSLETEQWETLYGEIRKNQNIIDVLQKNEIETKHRNQEIDRNTFLQVMNEIESPEELLKLIHMSVEKSSIEEVEELYKDIERNFKVEEAEKETIWNKKQKMKEFISSLETEQWETLYGELRKYENVISVLQKNELKSESRNQKIDKNSFIEVMNEIESPEKLVELIHMSAEKSSMEEVIELYQSIEKSVKMEEAEEQNPRYKNESIKEFIGTLETEQWETLYGELRKYQNVISLLEKSKVQIDYRNQKIDRDIFIEVINEIESPDKILELIHMSIEKGSIKELKERYKNMDYNWEPVVIKNENLLLKKERLKKFLETLEFQQLAEIQNQINKYGNVVNLFEKQKIYNEYTTEITDRNNVITNADKISNMVFLLNNLSHFSAEKERESNISEVKESQNLFPITKDFFNRIDEVNTLYKDKILSQEEDTKLLSYKTHFLDSIQDIRRSEELQFIYNILSEDEQLKSQAKLFGIIISEDVDLIHNKNSLMEQINNLEECISYMNLELWEKLYERIKTYHKNESKEEYENSRSTKPKQQYDKGVNDIIESLDELIVQAGNNVVDKTLYLSNKMEHYKKSISSRIDFQMLTHNNSKENNQFIPEYEAVHMITTTPAYSNKKITSEIVPDITHEIRTNIKETVDDIKTVVRKDNKLYSNTEFSKQLENVTKTMEIYKKEMEEIKLSQSKILQSTSSNQIAKKVLNQLQGQLRIEKMRRGLE